MLADPTRRGALYVIAAASGTGKTSLVKALLSAVPALRFSVSHTTRKARANEVNGRDYYFVDDATFNGMVARGEFLEHARVFDHQYGTSRAEVEKALGRGADLVLEIDWQGAQQVRGLIPEAIGIFILPPSPDTLRRRLIDRGQDSDAVIERRVQAARGEIAHLAEFDYVIINSDFDAAVEDLVSIVRTARLRTGVQISRHGELINLLK
jgi:guanylate kinase